MDRLLTTDPIDPSPLIAAARRDGDGGLAVFVGVVRDEADGRAVEALQYDAYEPMAEKELAAICRDLGERYPAVRLLVRHRFGLLRVGEVAVVIVASAPHRGEAFGACREAIEAIKVRVPIWKKEIGPGRAAWVEPNPAGC